MICRIFLLHTASLSLMAELFVLFSPTSFTPTLSAENVMQRSYKEQTLRIGFKIQHPRRAERSEVTFLSQSQELKQETLN